MDDADGQRVLLGCKSSFQSVRFSYGDVIHSLVKAPDRWGINLSKRQNKRARSRMPAEPGKRRPLGIGVPPEDEGPKLFELRCCHSHNDLSIAACDYASLS